MQNTRKRTKPAWLEIVQRYQKPTIPKSVWQIINSFIPYFLIWGLMIYSLNISYWIMLALAPFAAGFLMRIFIIQHDCGHQSFFQSRRANDLLGGICGILTWLPYHHWRTQHARHHANSGDLDFRGYGDIDTLTVNEYLQRNRWRRLSYRVFRDPLTMFLIVPSILFIFAHRFPFKTTKSEKRARASVWKTNAGIVAALLGVGYFIGYKEALLIQLHITVITASIGVFLFYVQHQFEETYWRRHPDWDYENAALKGSSFFKLPKVLQWFSGNIGFHHVHHLNPKIPNYLLEQAHTENELFQDVEPLTLGKSIQSIFLHLWDEDSERLISFREFRKLRSRA